jgi:hypothetical protein
LLRCSKASISFVFTGTLKVGIYLNIFSRYSRASHEADQAWLRAALVIGPFAVISDIFIADRKCCSVLPCMSWEAGERMTKTVRTIENEAYCLMGYNVFVLKMLVFSVKTQLNYLTNQLHVSATVL